MKKGCILICCLLLGGCMHAPAQTKTPPPEADATMAASNPQLLTKEFADKNIVKGKTTKEQIFQLYGKPYSVVKNGRKLSPELLATIKTQLPPIAITKEFWYYWTTPPLVGGTKVPVKKLMLFMDDNDVCVDYMVTETALEVP